MIDEGYRVPTEDEFVQGFKYEVKNEHSIVIMDLQKGGVSERSEPLYTWTEGEVFWKKEPKWVAVEAKNGHKITYDQAMDNFFEPFNVASFLEQGLLRTKIKKDE
jgi:hypothetical protein